MAQNETLGANLLMAVSMVGGALDDDRRQMLSKIKPSDWIPSELYLDFIRSVESRSQDKVKMIGRSIMYAGKSTFLTDLEPLTPVKVLQFITQAFERNNRGPDIGFWTILSLRDGFAELETTDYSGEFFVEGLLEGAVRVANGNDVQIEKRKARSRGDKTDVFQISWEAQ
jgi:hypothetical protein